MLWVAELDEPFAIDPLGQLLLDLDPAATILYEFVVGRENRSDFPLNGESRKRYPH